MKLEGPTSSCQGYFADGGVLPPTPAGCLVLHLASVQIIPVTLLDARWTGRPSHLVLPHLNNGRPSVRRKSIHFL
ncbi:hypothetical protein E2C01_037208 [Portunus trituberculatus]|uniref:Uncharacterized protein n=1 Tax=Portunus trituberculatus TaxID=210409 RepID=A0A5B7FEZ3_PORTR|nr:hypothetical protein [Portunus trituberculatus]